MLTITKTMTGDIIVRYQGKQLRMDPDWTIHVKNPDETVEFTEARDAPAV